MCYGDVKEFFFLYGLRVDHATIQRRVVLFTAYYSEHEEMKKANSGKTYIA
jgi:hypothetical protein